jgi:tetratricopeptide (TPR) repeat protein
MKNVEQYYSKYSGCCYPLFSAYKRVLDSYHTNPSDARNNIEDCIEVIIKYTTLYLYAGYKYEKHNNPKVDKLLSGLLVPSLGSYSQILTALTADMKKSSDVFSSIVTVLETKVSDNMLAALRKLSEYTDIDGLAPLRAKEQIYLRVIGSMVQYRNKTRGHGATENSEFIEHILDALNVVVTEFMDQFIDVFKKDLISVTSITKDDYGYNYNVIKWDGIGKQIGQIKSDTDDYNVGITYFVLQIGEIKEHIQISPFLTSTDQDKNSEVFFLNDAKKNHVEYLAYASGKKIKIEASSGKPFQKVMSLLEGFKYYISEGYRKPQIIDNESIDLYRKALVTYNEGAFETTVHLLDEAIRLSPTYVLCINYLADLYAKNNRNQDAISIILNYLDYMSGFPDQVDKELFSKLIVLLGDEKNFDKALGYMEGLGKEIYGKELADSFTELLHDGKIPHFDFIEYLDTQDKPFYLPYDLLKIRTEASNKKINDDKNKESKLKGFVTKTKSNLGILKVFKNSYIIVTLTVFLVTGISGYYISSSGNLLLGMTVYCLGVFWLLNVNAVYLFRRLIMNSRNNFCSFIKSLQEDGDGYYKLFIKMFGNFEPDGTYLRNIYASIKNNWKLIFATSFCSFVISALIYLSTLFVVNDPLVKYVYFAFLFLVYINFCYMASCLFNYTRIIKNLGKEQIHFTLIQHPKLSIKYVAILTERLLSVIMIIYIVGVSILYIGPFRQNTEFMGSLTASLLMLILLYYRIIFMVYIAVNKNKWDKVAKLSNKFIQPFNSMIDNGRISELHKIQELSEIRSFILKYNALPVSKMRLVLSSIVLLVFLVGVPIACSNIFPNYIVPSLFSKIEMNKLNLITKEFKTSDYSNLEINVEDVDDSFIVLYRSQVGPGSPELKGSDIFYEDEILARCDWKAAGEHGSMHLSIPKLHPSGRQEILLISYNKVYHGKMFFGGGKLSYSYTLSDKTGVLDEHTTFVRDNKKGIKTMKYIVLDKKSDGNVYIKIESNILAMPRAVIAKRGYIDELMAAEKDSVLF